MAKHLDDKTKKKIIAEYVNCGNYSEVARKFNTSVPTVKRVVNNDEKTLNKVKHKKEENIKNVLEWLERNQNKILSKCEMIIDSIDKDVVEMTPLNLKTIAFGTLIDKLTLPTKMINDKPATSDLESAIKAHWGEKDDNS